MASKKIIGWILVVMVWGAALWFVASRYGLKGLLVMAIGLLVSTICIFIPIKRQKH